MTEEEYLAKLVELTEEFEMDNGVLVYKMNIEREIWQSNGAMKVSRPKFSIAILKDTRGECCGDCKHFEENTLDEIGLCYITETFKHCSERCNFFKKKER